MKTVILLLSSLFCFNAQANQMAGAVSAGMGGTGRAAVVSNESLYLNPATIALMEGFYSGASYQTGFLRQDISRNTYSITMTDATEGIMLPGSFGYRKHSINNQGERLEENEFKVGLGYRITDRLSLGVGGTHLRAKNQVGEKFNQTNMDVGILVGLQPNWGLSFTGENIIKDNENRPLALNRLSRAALGTQYIMQRMITLRYETLMPLYQEGPSFLGHRFGLGLGMKGAFGLNAGYSVDDSLGQNWGSVGISWKGPRLKVAYSYQQETRADLGARHFVDLWLDI
jgi:hypothetical protein